MSMKPENSPRTKALADTSVKAPVDVPAELSADTLADASAKEDAVIAAQSAPGASAAGSAQLSAKQPQPNTSKRRRAAAIVAALLLLVVVGALAVGYFAKPPSDMEPNVIVGTLEEYTDEQIQDMLAKKVEEGMISFSLNTSMSLASPDAEATIKFENPPNNAKLTKLRIVRDDTGEQIYETGFVAPGTYVDAAKLDKQLDSGTYTCTGYISSYRQETKQYLGEAACALTITVA